MREMQNLSIARPAQVLLPAAENPIPLGQAGLWFDGFVVYGVDRLGNLTALFGSEPE